MKIFWHVFPIYKEIADTNISGQLSKDLITMKVKLASLQVLLPFYDVSSDKLETGIDLKATKGMFWQIKSFREVYRLGIIDSKRLLSWFYTYDYL